MSPSSCRTKYDFYNLHKLVVVVHIPIDGVIGNLRCHLQKTNMLCMITPFDLAFQAYFKFCKQRPHKDRGGLEVKGSDCSPINC